jgi:hypothetical protein
MDGARGAREKSDFFAKRSGGPGIFFRILLRAFQHRMRPGHRNASQITITLFRDRTEVLLAPTRICRGMSAIHAAKSRLDANAFGSVTMAVMAVAPITAIPGTAATRLLSSLALYAACCGHDPPLKRSDERLHCLKLGRQHDQPRASIDRQPLIFI